MNSWHDPILMSDPRVTSIPTADNGEKLVDLGIGGHIDVRRALSAHGEQGCMVRQGVAQRLWEAARLLPNGCRFALAEGYRPRSEQQRIFDGYRAGLAREWPHLSAAELNVLTTRHVANPAVNAPHSTGGAFDLTLVSNDGTELDMGTALDATPEESEMRCYTQHPGISQLAAQNRATLANALSKAGFVNYPTEWWHWSYGDRYWALARHATSTLYSSV